MKYYFTFMMKQTELKDKYVCIEGSFAESRAKMMEVHGDQWAFQYDEEAFAGQAEQFGLQEIPL